MKLIIKPLQCKEKLQCTLFRVDAEQSRFCAVDTFPHQNTKYTGESIECTAGNLARSTAHFVYNFGILNSPGVIYLHSAGNSTYITKRDTLQLGN